MNREDIYVALFDKLSKAPGIVTFDRSLKHWSDVPPVEQPALFQAQKTETAQTVTGQPTRWLLMVDIYVYVHAKTHNDKYPSTAINKIVDYIDDVLKPTFPVQGIQTLGGLVNYCRIEGTIETDEGKLGEQSMVIIPIQMQVS